MPSRCPEGVYGRGTVVRRVPFAVVTDTTPPDVATTSPLPWRVRRTRDTAGFLSPAVRRVVAERGLDVAQLRGTGAGGRVTREDALRASGGGAQSPHEVIPFNRVQQRAGAALLA